MQDKQKRVLFHSQLVINLLNLLAQDPGMATTLDAFKSELYKFITGSSVSGYQ